MKKLTAIILAAVMLIGMAAESIAFAATSLDEAMETASLYKKSNEHIRFISPYGVEAEDFYAHFVVHKLADGTELPAYCINPNKAGVGGSTGITEMDVGIDDPITDHAKGQQILGAIANGYPNKTPAELGLQTEYEAFSATKYAIWAIVSSSAYYQDPANWQKNAASSDQAACQRVLDAMRKIHAAAIAMTSAPSDLKATAMWGHSYNDDTQDYVVTVKVAEVTPTPTPTPTPSTPPTPTPTPPVVTDPPPQVGGLKILKYDAVTNQLTPGAIFEVRGIDPTNDKILFQVQASSGAALPGVEPGVTVETLAGQISIMGLPLGKYQITELTPPPHYDVSPSELNSKIVEVQASSDATVHPQVTFRNNPFGKLRVTKIDAVTGLPVPGIWLRIRNPLTGFDVTRQTNSARIIELGDLPQGNYEISEVNSGADYELSDKVLVVPIRWGELSEATFNNEPHTSLELLKISSKSNKPIAGAVFTLTNLSTGAEWTLTTLTDGRAVQNNIPAGNYTVQEIYVPEPLILDTTVVNLQIDNYKVNKFTFKNDEKPTVTIEKYDEQSGELLDGAEFRLEQLDGVFQTEFMMDESGKRTFTLSPGTYRFTEIAAPWGYLIATKCKDFVVKPNDDIVIKFDNRPRPKLRILKVDAVTGQPLPNAEFRVTAVESATVSEYITGSSGEILIENLDEFIYRAEEFMAPDGYIRLDESKEILLEWDKTKTLKFDNIRKPVAVFQKTNALTGRGIAGATFKVEYEQPGGGLRNLGSFRTDTSGRIVIPKAEVGWYVFTETLPAPGFSLPSNPVTRMYFGPGDNAYLDEFDHFYSGGLTASTKTGAVTTKLAVTIEEHSGSEYYVSPHDASVAGTPVQGEGFNWPLNSIVIKKTHAITGELLAGATFELYRADEQVSGVPGTAIGRYTTDNSGIVVITSLEPGYYVVKEVQAPANFLISENSQQNGFLKADGTTVLEFAFANYPYGSLLVSKVDALTGTPLANARFKVVDSSGAVVGNSNGEYVTDSRGEILIPNVKPGAYVVTEIQAPANFAVNTTPQTVQVGADGKTYKVTFENYPYSEIVIRKLDFVSHEPLAGAEFKVTASDGSVVGTGNGVFKTDATGTVKIPNLAKGSYVIEEIKPPSGYVLENQAQTVAVDYGKSYTIDVYNKKLSGVQIIKIDAATKAPLKDAKFTVYRKSGEVVGNYTTNGEGIIIIDNLSPGWYKCVETKAPDGWLLDDTPQDFEVTANQFIKLTFENKQLSSLQIRKVNEADGAPLAGAVFEVRKQNGEYIGEFTTDADGAVGIPNALPGWYLVSEIKAPAGFILDNAAKTVEVKPVTPTVVTVTNRKLSGLQIIKLDAATGEPLPGAKFTVYKKSGEVIGEYTTDQNGVIIIDNLTSGWYKIAETKAPDGFLISDAPKDVEVTHDQFLRVVFTNERLAGIQIVKLDSVTKAGIPGVLFAVTKLNGEKIGDFTTGKDGTVHVPNLEPGEYIVTEIRAADGYLIDAEPRTVSVTWGNSVRVEVENAPMSGLLIVKTDEATRKPLAGVVFDVTRADGQRVAGSISDENQPNTEASSPNKTTSPNGDISGSYTTDAQGRILINTLPAGEYHVTERKPLEGYEIDTEVHAVTVTPGKLATLQLTNRQKAGLRLLKIDSVTKLPIYNVEFCVFDSSNKVVGNYYTDNNGIIDFSGILSEGRYTIRETRAADGYYRDDLPRTVEFVSGKVTEIRWENTVRP